MAIASGCDRPWWHGPGLPGPAAAPERIVAIKVIAPELAADPTFRARFDRESTMAAEIEHPNVIPVYEVGEEDSRCSS